MARYFACYTLFPALLILGLAMLDCGGPTQAPPSDAQMAAEAARVLRATCTLTEADPNAPAEARRVCEALRAFNDAGAGGAGGSGVAP